MKILESKYPMGSFTGQKSAGKYIDKAYYENLEILAKAMGRDMTWLAVFYSSTLEVGTGKSTFMQQTAEAWISIINKLYNKNLSLDMKNIVFKPKELIDRAFKLEPYSPIILDEWEDAHFWSELGMSLRQFFRKCRQLNLFIMIAIPNYFQLPMNYAISRSVFAVDVKFVGTFERGYFSFYNFPSKKELYIKGKKTQDYNCIRPNFSGRFTDGYAVDEAAYRKAKYADMLEGDKKQPTEHEVKVKLIKQMRVNNPKITIKELAIAFGVGERTAQRWISEVKIDIGKECSPDNAPTPSYNIIPIKDRDNFDEDEPVQQNKEEVKDNV